MNNDRMDKAVEHMIAGPGIMPEVLDRYESKSGLVCNKTYRGQGNLPLLRIWEGLRWDGDTWIYEDRDDPDEAHKK